MKEKSVRDGRARRPSKWAAKGGRDRIGPDWWGACESWIAQASAELDPGVPKLELNHRVPGFLKWVVFVSLNACEFTDS